MNLLIIKTTELITLIGIGFTFLISLLSIIVNIKSINGQKEHEYKMIFYKSKMEFLIDLITCISELNNTLQSLISTNDLFNKTLINKYSQLQNKLFVLCDKSFFYLQSNINNDLTQFSIDNEALFKKWNFNSDLDDDDWNNYFNIQLFYDDIKKTLIEEKNSFMKKS